MGRKEDEEHYKALEAKERAAIANAGSPIERARHQFLANRYASVFRDQLTDTQRVIDASTPSKNQADP